MIQEQAIQELLHRTVEEVIDRKGLEQKLHSGRKLRVKLGIDPTSPNLHIGRAVALWKLRAFQELGHRVVFIVGDFTGLIGDTSDKDAERPMLTGAQIKTNLKTYLDQAFRILDKKRAETHFNSKWLKKLGFLEIGQMADLFGLHEFEARKNISKRLKAGKRVSLRELLYPLMQGYDSAAVKADVELGGTDQRFNLLAGRTVQKFYGQPPQDILTVELLEGTDGRKMSSSWGNTINLTDSAEDMFGKLMGVPDALIEKYFVFATRLPINEIKQFLAKTRHPRDQKLRLALEVTKLYHEPSQALKVQANFLSRFSRKELPGRIPSKRLKSGEYWLSEILTMTGLSASKSEARRLILQKGVKLNQSTLAADRKLKLDGAQKFLLQVGKLKILEIS